MLSYVIHVSHVLQFKILFFYNVFTSMLQAESDERAERSAADEVADLTAASSVLPGMFT